MSFFRELKKRRVPQVVGLYAAAAWALLEVASLVLDAFEMPAWVLRALVMLALIGFGLAVFLAWEFQVTDEGIRRTPVAGARGWFRILVAGVLAVMGVGLVLTWSTRDSTEPENAGQAPMLSIAVLAFANMSGDPAYEYLSDGVAEQLLHGLARLGPLKVAARTSSFSFKNSTADIGTIASRLGVRHVLEGSVRRSGDTLRVTAQLIDAADGFHVWSEEFDGDIDDVFGIQEQISRAIMAKLEVTLLDPLAGPGAGTTNVTAYDHYLLGTHHAHRRDHDSLTKALTFFDRALTQDPDYAPAHAGRARTYAFLIQYTDRDPQVLGTAAQDSIDQALAIDPLLDEAYGAECALYFVLDDRVRSEAACRRALDLNPNSADYLMWLANGLSDRGRLDEAYEFYVRALAVNPLHATLLLNVAETDIRLGLFRRAEARLRQAYELQPDHPYVLVLMHENMFCEGDENRQRAFISELQQRAAQTGSGGDDTFDAEQGLYALSRGDYSLAARHMERALPPPAAAFDFIEHAETVTGLAHAYQRLGRQSEAEALLEQPAAQIDAWLDDYRVEGIAQHTAAGVYAVLGDRSKALAALRASSLDGIIRYYRTRRDRRFETLHEDARYQTVLAELAESVTRMRAAVQSRDGAEAQNRPE